MYTLSFKLGHFIFKAPATTTIVTALVVAMLCGLGQWQLQRAAFKRALLQAYLAQQQAAPVKLQDLSKNQLPSEFARVETTGKFDNKHIVLLDNQFYLHRPGYHMVMPFLPENDPWVILVDRGWIPMPRDRAQLPAFPNIPGTISLQGNVRYLQNQGLLLGENIEAITSSEWRVARMDTAFTHQLSQKLAKPIYPFILTLSPKTAYAFASEAALVLNMPPERHVAYAIQWFVLAFIAFGIYVFFHLRKE